MDRPPNTEDEENEIYREPRGWLGLTFLTWSVVISCLLHSSLLIPSFLEIPRGEADVDLEWLKSFDTLEGLGHGSDGRWAEIDTSSFATRQDDPQEEPQTEPEPEPEPETPPEPQPEPEVKPEPTAKPQPKPATANAAKPKKRDIRKPKKPTSPQEVYAEGDLPGLDRAGPNGLPAMDGYGPGNAIFTALLRFEGIKGSEFEEPVRKLMSAIPDYRILLEGTGIDPVTHFHSLFMASSNPIYIDETFLAVRHRDTRAVMKQRLDRRFEDRIGWRTQHGLPTRALVPKNSPYQDVRQIALPSNDLALVVRPEWLKQLTNELPDGAKMLEGVDVEALDRRPTMLDGLNQIERAASEDTILLMSAMGARIAIPGVGRLTFEGAKLQVSNIDAPKLDIDIALATEAEATRFAGKCPTLKKRVLAQVPWIAQNIVRMVIDRLTCKSSGNYVAIAGTYTREEAQRLLNIATPFVPRPPILSRLPKAKNPMRPPDGRLAPAPRKKATEQPDMGTDAEADSVQGEQPDGGQDEQDG